MKNASQPPNQPPKKSLLKKLKQKAFPLAVIGSLLAHEPFAHQEIKSVALDTHAKIKDYFKSNATAKLAKSEFAELEGQLPPSQIDRVKDQYKRSELDKQAALSRIKEREAAGKKFLEEIYKNYDNIDLKEVVWQLEYYFQGVTDEDYKEAHEVILRKLLEMNFEGQDEPTVEDLQNFHQTFIPQGPRDDIKSSAVEFLAGNMDSRLQNCDAASKTLILALLTKYPNLRNSLYFQFFKKHVRLIVQLKGQKHIFEWKEVSSFPDAPTEFLRNAIVPIDVYYALVAGRHEETLLKRIQHFGPKHQPKSNSVDVPNFTNNNIPLYNVSDDLDEYRSQDEAQGNYQHLQELANAKTDLAKEKITLKINVTMVIPATTDEEKRRFKLFNEHGGFDNPIGLNFWPSPPPILIKMDQISLSDLKTMLDSLPKQKATLGGAKIIFTGLKKADHQTISFIIEHFQHNELAFEDLEELNAEDLAKMFETTEDPTGNSFHKRKSIDFFSLENIKGDAPNPAPLKYFDLKDLLLSEQGEEEISIKKSKPIQVETPSISYKEVNLTFHCLTDMSYTTAEWLANRKGKITFGSEANLSAKTAEKLIPFEGDLSLINSHAVSLVQGLEKRQAELSYIAPGLNKEMAEALASYKGNLSIPQLDRYYPELEAMTKRTGKLIINPSFGMSVENRQQYFKILSQKKGDLTIQLGQFFQDESKFLKDHLGDLYIIISITEIKKEDIENLAGNKGKLTISIMGTINNSNFFTPEFLDPLKNRDNPTKLIFYILNDVDFDKIEGLTGFKSPLIIHISNAEGITEDIIKKLANNFSVDIMFSDPNFIPDPKLNSIAPNVKIHKVNIE